MAVASRQVEPGLILHSDRGVQYRSGEYQALLLNEGIQPSMSRKGNCWDNAAMESFFARFKVEALYAEDITNKQEAYARVFDYIELFYNRRRRHSTLGYQSPNAYEHITGRWLPETVSTFGGEDHANTAGFGSCMKTCEENEECTKP